MGLLTDDEIREIKSMGIYWREVAKRDNVSPLKDEFQMIARKYNYRLLFILLEYAEENDVEM